MATIANDVAGGSARVDHLSGTERAHALDRWIYVVMAGLLIVTTLVGFVPDSMAKMAAVQAGQRPPFPLVLHVHAVLMASFLLLLLAQTTLVALGRPELHKTLGMVSVVLVPALVIAGFILVPTTYYGLWGAAQFGPPPVKAQMAEVLPAFENIMLLQIRIGILFALFIGIALAARKTDAGLHKRMMILGTAAAMPAATDRMTWLWSTMPASPLTADLWPILLLVPMFAWDVVRNGRVHRAYVIWAAVYLPFAIAVNLLWDTPFWHATAKQIMGV